MQRNIQKITQQFVDRLPENDQYYRPEELRSWGFPAFLVKRIKIELRRNLEESLIIPKTDWANTKSDSVQIAWQKFVDAIQAETRLPASYGKTVIETAVADIVEMLIQPRKNIPEVVFGQETQLNYDEVCERVKTVVVYPHFAKLLPRYMQKKELDKLMKDRCKKIVSKADEKLTARYSPLNWAQMLEPLFKLVDGEIDTNLLRLFFEDKNKPRVARKFDLMNDMLTRAELIEVLSSPELLDFEGYEDDQSGLFEDQPASKDTEQKRREATLSERIADKQKLEEEDRSENEASTDISEESGETADLDVAEDESESAEEEDIHTLNSGFVEKEEPVDESDDDDDSLNAIFKNEDEEEREKDEITETEPREKEPKDEESLANDEARDEQSEEEQNTVENDEIETDTEEADQSNSTEVPPKNNGDSQASGEQEESPIWMRFMSEEEIEEYDKQQQKEEAADEEVEEGFIDDPIVDLTQENADEEDIESLRDQLSGDRELFVEEIFRGSDRAFEEAVENIAVYDNWREASKYIEKEIFKRNLVDMYSEAAVSFTDQLQSYFSNK